jgi:hypothetical protein
MWISKEKVFGNERDKVIESKRIVKWKRLGEKAERAVALIEKIRNSFFSFSLSLSL